MKKKFLLFSVILLLIMSSCGNKKKSNSEEVYLSTSFPMLTYSLDVPSDGAYYLSVSIHGDNFAWNRSSCPSVVIDVFRSRNVWAGSLILWDPNFEYTLFLGDLKKGSESLTFKFSPEKSPCSDAKIEINKLQLVKFSGISEACIANVPYLLGYKKTLTLDGKDFPYNTMSDLPLFWVCKKEGERLEYILYYSNEDGGTGVFPGVLMYTWGRVADIENAFTVDLGSDKEYMRDNETEDTLFQGENYLGHPLLMVSPEDHGLVTEGKIEDDTKQLLFALPVYPAVNSAPTREDYLDMEPWTYLIMEWEMEREGKITTEESKLSDQCDFLAPLDYYLYLDLYISDETKIAMDVKLSSGDEITNNSSGLSWNFSGWKRVVLKLPEEVKLKNIEEIRMVNLGDTKVKVEIGKLFYLNRDFSTLHYIVPSNSPISSELSPHEDWLLHPIR